MCPYALWKEDNTVICEPRNEMCTFCVAGNAKTFYEIERQINPSFIKLEETINKMKNTEKMYGLNNLYYMEIKNAESI